MTGPATGAAATGRSEAAAGYGPVVGSAWDPLPGNVCGEAQAATTLAQLPPGRRRWLRFYFGLRRMFPGLMRRLMGTRLESLSFIHFATWSIIDRLPHNPPAPPERWKDSYLLFQVNFNGSWAEYIDAFSYVLGWRLKLVWGGARGFPGPRPAEAFKGYIRRNELAAAHYYCAYPEATTTVVLAALELKDRLEAFLPDTRDAGPGQFARRFDDLVTDLQDSAPSAAAPPIPGRGPRAWLRERPWRAESGNRRGSAYNFTVLTPIRRGEEQALRQVLAGLPTDADSPLARVSGMHFGRWLVLSHLSDEAAPRDRDRLASHQLLFTTTFDGTLDDHLNELCEQMPHEADAIWGLCAGCPGSVVEHRDAFKGYLKRNQVHTGLFAAAYPAATVSRVRESLDCRRRLYAFVLAGRREPERLQEDFRREFAECGR